MGVATKLIAWQEFSEIKDEPNRHELIRGELVTMPPPHTFHGFYANRLALKLGTHVERHRLGVVLAAETGFLIETDPDTVRAADVAFVAAARWPTKPFEGYFRGAPDFVAEVLSQSDVMLDVDTKIDAWLAAGTKLLWLVNPKRKSVTAFRPGGPPALLVGTELADAGDVVTGFSLSVSEIVES